MTFKLTPPWFCLWLLWFELRQELCHERANTWPPALTLRPSVCGKSSGLESRGRQGGDHRRRRQQRPAQCRSHLGPQAPRLPTPALPARRSRSPAERGQEETGPGSRGALAAAARTAAGALLRAQGRGTATPRRRAGVAAHTARSSAIPRSLPVTPGAARSGRGRAAPQEGGSRRSEAAR